MRKSSRIQIPLRASLSMLGSYFRRRLTEQIKAVAFIVFYLSVFQIVVQGAAPANAWKISGGILLVILGLTFFLDGLILGLMPLGERVGLKLPQRVGLVVILLFGFLLGIGSTLAEPAVAALRAMGGSIKAWEAPLLFYLLEHDPEKLVVAIGLGVGFAVALGMLRLFFAWSIKPFIYALVPVMLGMSIYCAADDKLFALLGLAWDAGAVTTGAVTVPLVLALGIGVSRSVRKQQVESGGFGMIMLASALPVLGVLVLGLMLSPAVPHAMPESDFFASENREESKKLFVSDQALRQHAFGLGSHSGRAALLEEKDAHIAAVQALADPRRRRELLGNQTLSAWLRLRASEQERLWLTPLLGNDRAAHDPNPALPPHAMSVMTQDFIGAIRAVTPLTALLLVVLMWFLRDRLRHHDELVLGIMLSLLGMALLTGGIRIGLASLGNEVGRSLPRAFRVTAIEEGRLWLADFDIDQVIYAYSADGTPTPHFHLKDKSGNIRLEPFAPERFDFESGRYEHILKRPPLLHPRLTFAGVGLVLLFAFGLGYGSTLAEPALAALGRKVEEITVGTVRSTKVVRAVSIGVGVGLVAGVARILYDIPTLWLLAPPYLVLLWLTWASEEDFAGIAWDCGGVTTGVVTVPLVMAMGLGVGEEMQIVDAFGALAMASVYPILTVLTYGIFLRSRQRRAIRAGREKTHV